MLAELYHRDPRGLTVDRRVEDKLVLTCRYVAILMASFLKAKGIPARVRSGFGSYFEGESIAWDHWVIQYWKEDDDRWITVDVDGSLHKTGFDMYDIPEGKFDWSADAWHAVRSGKIDGKHFRNAGGPTGLYAIILELFYDFHSLMNSEIIYMHGPDITRKAVFEKITEEKLKEIDKLAHLMQTPDENFEKLQDIWNTNKEFRLLKGSLL